MEKIICDICGSEFDESLSQCPICGCAKKEAAPESTESAYVKGGRFSKSNVRRRLKPETAGAASESVREYVKSNDERNIDRNSNTEDAEEEQTDPRSNRPLLLVVILLLLAIIAVSLYIVIAFSDSADPGDSSSTPSSSISVPDDDGPCSSVSFSVAEVKLDKTNPSKKLTVIKEPVNTLDTLSFVSSDPSVVSVDAQGNVTALKKGTVTITVTCGSRNATVTVISEYEFPTLPSTLPTTPPTTLPTSPFVIPTDAKSFDPISVTVKATDANIRKGPGTNYDVIVQLHAGDKLTISKEYTSGGYTWALSDKGWVVKSFLSIPSAAGDSAYKIRINGQDPNYGTSVNAECSLGVGDSIRLEIVDGNGNPVNVTWNVSKTGLVSFNGNKVSRTATGTVKLTVSLEGQEYVMTIY